MKALILSIQILCAVGFGSNRLGAIRFRSRGPNGIPLSMISNLGNNAPGGSKDLPRDVKEAVQACREATQAALRKKISRMDIEFPVGTKFNVEKDGTKRKSGETPTQDELERSNRELARLFVDMFQPVGGNSITVAFNDVDLADMARKKWKGDPTAASRIVSVDRRKSNSGKKKKKNSRGFAAKLAKEVDDSLDDSGPFKLPENTIVAIFVAPGPKELVIVERICSDVGMDTLIILVNARLATVSNFGSTAAKKLFMEKFVPVFNLSAAQQEAAPGCLLFRTFPGDWVLARKPKIGAPKTILVQPSRPNEKDSKKAYNSIELSDVEKGVESVVENFSGWFS